MIPLLDLPAAELRARVGAGDVSALAVTDEVFARAETVGAGRDGLNVFLSHDREWSRAQAEARDALVAGARVPTGELLGVPVAIKDNLATVHLPTTCG